MRFIIERVSVAVTMSRPLNLLQLTENWLRKRRADNSKGKRTMRTVGERSCLLWCDLIVNEMMTIEIGNSSIKVLIDSQDEFHFDKIRKRSVPGTVVVVSKSKCADCLDYSSPINIHPLPSYHRHARGDLIFWPVIDGRTWAMWKFKDEIQVSAFVLVNN